MDGSEPNPEFVLYTIGHSNHSEDDFVALLQRHGVTVLVDVRSKPYSQRNPQFNREVLKDSIEKKNIAYRFAGEYLGGQPKDAAVYRDGEVPDDDTERAAFLKRVQYKAVMQQDWYQRGIRHLLKIIEETQQARGKVAIMCSEGDPKECHRHHLVTRSLIDPDVKIVSERVEVRHILRDGSVSVADAQGFAPEQQRLF